MRAALSVLRYIRGNPDAGLTYHGSAAVVGQSYDHRNKLIDTFDATFPLHDKRCGGGVEDARADLGRPHAFDQQL